MRTWSYSWRKVYDKYLTVVTQHRHAGHCDRVVFEGRLFTTT